MRVTSKNKWEVDRLMLSGEANISFSQLGEDSIVWHFLKRKSHGFYVDIGCFDPFRYSNTTLLYNLAGWHGINVDANTESIEKFKIHRPNDINVVSAVGLDVGIKTLSVFDDGAVNSLDPALAASQQRKFGTPRLVDVEVRTLADILEHHLPENTAIDLLDIDVEGWDLEVLQSNNWDRFRPTIIAVESHDFDLSNPQVHATFKFLSDVNYKLVSHAVVTSIFITNQ